MVALLVMRTSLASAAQAVSIDPTGSIGARRRDERGPRREGAGLVDQLSYTLAHAIQTESP